MDTKETILAGSFVAIGIVIAFYLSTYWMPSVLPTSSTPTA